MRAQENDGEFLHLELKVPTLDREPLETVCHVRMRNISHVVSRGPSASAETLFDLQ